MEELAEARPRRGHQYGRIALLEPAGFPPAAIPRPSRRVPPVPEDPALARAVEGTRPSGLPAAIPEGTPTRANADHACCRRVRWRRPPSHRCSGERGRREVRDAACEPDLEARLDAHGELGVEQAEDDTEVGPQRPRVQRGREIDEVVARGGDERRAASPGRPRRAPRLAGIAAAAGCPARAATRTGRSPPASTATTLTPCSASSTATRYPMEPSPHTMT